jgi:hypothetical protein
MLFDARSCCFDPRLTEIEFHLTVSLAVSHDDRQRAVPEADSCSLHVRFVGKGGLFLK